MPIYFLRVTVRMLRTPSLWFSTARYAQRCMMRQMPFVARRACACGAICYGMAMLMPHARRRRYADALFACRDYRVRHTCRAHCAARYQEVTLSPANGIGALTQRGQQRRSCHVCHSTRRAAHSLPREFAAALMRYAHTPISFSPS